MIIEGDGIYLIMNYVLAVAGLTVLSKTPEELRVKESDRIQMVRILRNWCQS